MPTLLKSFFDRRKEPSQEEIHAMDCARMALQSRVDNLMRKESNRFSFDQTTTDAFGRALQ